MKQVSRPRVLGIFMIVLLCFLGVTALFVASQQRHLLYTDTYQHAVQNLDLITDATFESLLKSDYVTVRTFVKRWGETHHEIHEIRVVAPNGYLVADYRKTAPDADEFYTLSKEVVIAGNPLVTIHLVGDYRKAREIMSQLWIRLILSALIIAALLGGALWVTFRKLALAPLEDMVNERTRALTAANQELEQEIGDRISAQEELREREEHFTLILNSIAEGIYDMDLEGNCTFCNPAALRLLGYESAEEVVGKNIHKLIHHTRPDGSAYDEADCSIHRCDQTGQGRHADDEVFWRSDGTSFSVEYWAQSILRDNTPIGIVTAFADITERKQTAEALKRSEKLLQTIIDTEPDCVKMIDAQGKLILMNRAGLDMIEADTLEQVKGECICPLVTSGYRQAFMDLTSRVFEGNSGALTFEMVGMKGRHLWLETRAVPFRNEKNEIVALLGITQDITMRRKLEAQLLQSQKMESIGTLAGGVAHDFNNILTAIIGYGHITLMKMAEDDPHRANIEQILEAADRAAHLTKDLLLFSRKQSADRKPVDLNAVIRNLQKFLVRVIGEDIAIRTALSGSTLTVSADEHQFGQVLMNLVTNARDAMPRGGTLEITTELVTLAEEFIRTHGLAQSGSYALISISDTGQGMDKETIERIFEPFYTTKETGKGTGLGLAVVYGIIREHEGYISVYSEPGMGTTFRIYLPVIACGEAGRKLPLVDELPVGGTETILLAEDNEKVRDLTEKVLRDFGYSVIAAADGDDAVNKYRENMDRIQLLLFDLIMPHKSGKEAYDEIRTLRPDIKAIFASGYSPDILRDKAFISSDVTIVYKPTSPLELLKKVRSVLDQGNT